MAYINLIYCSICTAPFTTRGRPGQVGKRGRREDGRRGVGLGEKKKFLKGISSKTVVKSKE